jgi:predicted flap endonuclease-1-like 5' DNA nuclease
MAILHQDQPYFTEYHKMTKPQIKIVDVTSGEEIVRDATAAEISQIKLDADNAKARKAEAEANEAQRQAILDRIGLTADELQTILG